VTYTRGFFLRKGPWIVPSPLHCPYSQLLDFCTLTGVISFRHGQCLKLSVFFATTGRVEVTYTCHLNTELTQFKNNTVVSTSSVV
jgi:hypothetical protein